MGIGQRLLEDTPLVLSVEAAIAVGVTILIMAVTNTEHGPAAGLFCV